MCRTEGVFVLLALWVGLAYSFSWDVVVGDAKVLKFYYNGTLTHTEVIPSATEIFSVTYDPVHYRLIFGDYTYPNMSISSIDLSTRTIQPIFTRKSNDFFRVAYDPVTQLLFWQAEAKDIYSFSLNPASSNKAVDGNLLVTTNFYCYGIAVDSCGGFIYWITDYEIERARFDGSEREVLIDSPVYLRLSLAIDQHTQKMYWIEKLAKHNGYLSIESAEFNGKNRRTLYADKYETLACSLAVTKDFIYWDGCDQHAIRQLPKNPHQTVAAKLFSISSTSCMVCQRIAANYSINDLVEENQSCESLKSLVPNHLEPHSTDVNLLCANGTKVNRESCCVCTPGYIGERCDVSVCQNYCFQRDCSVSVKGQPKCSCKAGFSGERCEVDACYNHCLNSGVCSLNEEHDPVCQCTTGYEGVRCDFSVCKDYCLQGNCSVSADGQPYCSCSAGYSGKRCEVNACYKYCLNNGVCFLNEEEEIDCQCTEDYEGERCDIATTQTGINSYNMMQQILRDLRTEVKQVIREELQCTLQFYSDKIDENEAKIQKCEKSIKDLEKRSTERVSSNPDH